MTTCVTFYLNCHQNDVIWQNSLERSLRVSSVNNKFFLSDFLQNTSSVIVTANIYILIKCLNLVLVKKSVNNTFMKFFNSCCALKIAQPEVGTELNETISYQSSPRR